MKGLGVANQIVRVVRTMQETNASASIGIRITASSS